MYLAASSLNEISIYDDEIFVDEPDPFPHTPPLTPLSICDGDSCTGQWTLTVTDHNIGDAGLLNSWQLRFTTEDTDSFVFEGATAAGVAQAEFMYNV